MADRGHRLAGIEEVFYEFNRFRIHPQFVGIDDAAWQQECIESRRIGGVEWNVDCNELCPFLNLPPANLAFLRLDDLSPGPDFVQCLAWFDKLILLKALIDKNGYRLAGQIFLRHWVSSSYFGRVAAEISVPIRL